MKKRKKGEIGAIIFDVGGVLALGTYFLRPKKGHSTRVHDYIARKLRIPVDQWFDSIDTAYADSIDGTISEKKAMSVISKNLKITPKRLEKLFKKSYKKNFKQNKKLYKIAFKLKKQGYKIAILSDQLYASKKALILEKYSRKFDVVVISCDVGLRKPDIKIYKLALKKLKVSASSSVFIDNQTWNLKPAKKLGMKTILFKGNKQAVNEMRKLKIKI